MKRDHPKNIVASVQARLVERSRELGVEHQLTLARFGGERLLFRLRSRRTYKPHEPAASGGSASRGLSVLADDATMRA